MPWMAGAALPSTPGFLTTTLQIMDGEPPPLLTWKHRRVIPGDSDQVKEGRQELAERQIDQLF
jgi:hypothetical protein